MTATLPMLAQTPVDARYALTAGGWITMILSVGFVTILCAWCVWRVMRESSLRKLHGPVDADIDTRDTLEA